MAAPQNYLAVIKVIGVGGGGVNAINRMIEVGLKGVEFIAINTDAQALLMSDADVKLDVGRELTRGLGAGANPAVGRKAAEDHREGDRGGPQGGRHGLRHRRRRRRHRHRRRTCRRQHRALARRPDDRCGHPPVHLRGRRANQAEDGIAELREEVDTLIVIPNDRLLSISDRQVSVLDAFKSADQVLLSGVQGITDLITTPGLINLDFADVKSVMSEAGSALMGIGSARGDDRAVAAAEMAISSPLLEASIDGARGVLLSISGGSDLGLFEINEAAQLVSEAAHPEANIIFGAVIDDALGDEVRVTVIAVGLRRRTAAYPAARTYSAPTAPSGRSSAAPARPATPEPVRPAGGLGSVPPREESPAPAEQLRPPRRREREHAPARLPAARPDGPSLPGHPGRRAGRTGLLEVIGQHPATAVTGSAHFAFTDRWGGVSSAPYGELNLGGAVGDDPAAVGANRERAARDLGIDPARVVWMNQVHGRDVAVVDGPWGADADIPAVDAVVTARRGLPLAVLTADCTPVLLADPVAGVAGAAHAGRPGLVAGVVPATVEAMVALGAHPSRITAHTGSCRLRPVLRSAGGDARRGRRSGPGHLVRDELGHPGGRRHRRSPRPARRPRGDGPALLAALHPRVR